MPGLYRDPRPARGGVAELKTHSATLSARWSAGNGVRLEQMACPRVTGVVACPRVCFLRARECLSPNSPPNARVSWPVPERCHGLSPCVPRAKCVPWPVPECTECIRPCVSWPVAEQSRAMSWPVPECRPFLRASECLSPNSVSPNSVSPKSVSWPVPEQMACPRATVSWPVPEQSPSNHSPSDVVACPRVSPEWSAGNGVRLEQMACPRVCRAIMSWPVPECASPSVPSNHVMACPRVSGV
jgi:hypothetical protein